MNILNKRARYDYELEEERIEAGISLSGGEAKAVGTGHVDLSQSVGRVLGNEAWLINANIPIPGAKNYNSTRSRKLLLHGSEILFLATKMKQRKLTLIPLSMYTRGRLIKVKLALGKPKRKFEKKEAIKIQEIKREIEKEFKEAK